MVFHGTSEMKRALRERKTLRYAYIGRSSTRFLGNLSRSLSGQLFYYSGSTCVNRTLLALSCTT